MDIPVNAVPIRAVYWRKTVAEPPGMLPRAQEPLRSQSEARNHNDSPAWHCDNFVLRVFQLK